MKADIEYDGEQRARSALEDDQESTMQPSISVELKEAVLSLAKEHGLLVSHDTHYDANNLEVSWWEDRVFHRLDFQPVSEQQIQINSIKESYPIFPRLLCWVRRHIPMFQFCATQESINIGQINQALSGDDYARQIHNYFLQVEAI